MLVAELIPAMTERIVRRVQPLKVILFGSQARGDAGPRSDVDLLVVLPQGRDERQAILAIHDELRDFRLPADVIVTTPAEIARRGNMVGTILRPALREGRLLFSLDGESLDGESLDGESLDDEDAEGGVPGVSDGEIWREVGLWLQFAEEDLATAELLVKRRNLVPRQAAFLAQQAAEKALKSIYIQVQADYPYVHDLDTLRNGLPEGWRLKVEFPDLKSLSLWAVAERYPGVRARSTRDDALQDVRQARALIAAVVRELAEHGYECDAEP